MKIDPPPKKASGKVFDVMRPGKAPASSTSKPVIVGHKPEIKDPAITINGVGEARKLMDSRKKIQVTPTDGDLATSSPGVAAQRTTKAAQSAAGQDGDMGAPTSAPEAPKASIPADEPKEQEEFALGEAAVEAVTTPQAPAADVLPAAPIDHELQGFVVSHHDTSGQRIKMLLLLAAMIFLAVAAIDILLDAELVHWPLPHTNWF